MVDDDPLETWQICVHVYIKRITFINYIWALVLINRSACETWKEMRVVLRVQKYNIIRESWGDWHNYLVENPTPKMVKSKWEGNFYFLFFIFTLQWQYGE